MNQNSLKCNQCDLLFDQSAQLVVHYVNEHPNSPEAIKIKFARAKRRWNE
jgi:hypothetical protein